MLSARWNLAWEGKNYAGQIVNGKLVTENNKKSCPSPDQWMPLRVVTFGRLEQRLS